MAKPEMLAKIGTKSQTRVVLWKEYKEGDEEVLAMESDLYWSLHWSYRRKKSCRYWKRYMIWKANPESGFLYLSH